jgi:hypothetical protein
MRRARALGVSVRDRTGRSRDSRRAPTTRIPEADDLAKVRYSRLGGPPKDLDPAVTYNVSDHAITANVYETLLEYHYLKRPYELMPGLAEAVPTAESRRGRPRHLSLPAAPGRALPAGPCFALGAPGSADREIVAADVAFEIDADRGSDRDQSGGRDVREDRGLRRVHKRLVDLRKADPGFAKARGSTSSTRPLAASRDSSCAGATSST